MTNPTDPSDTGAVRHWPDRPPLRIADRYAVGRPAGGGGARGLVTARGA